MKYPLLLIPMLTILVLPCGQSPAAPPATNGTPPKADADAKEVAFFADLFSDAEFVSKMKPIVGALHISAIADMNVEQARKHEARIAKQWKEQAGLVFFARLEGAVLTQSDILGFTSKMYKGNYDRQDAIVGHILRATGADAKQQIDIEFVRLALSYIHGKLTEEMWGMQPTSTIRDDDRSVQSLPGAHILIGYACTGGHTPGNYYVTIHDAEATIVTPGRPPVASRVAVAADEVEHFLALLRLGDFFRVPTTRPPTGVTVIDQPTTTLTLTVGGKTHAADCTDTQDTYLQELMRLFSEIINKQQAILRAEAAVTMRTPPNENLLYSLSWHMPLRAQRETAREFLNKLLECRPVQRIVACDVGGNIGEAAALANARTIEILVAKLNTRDRYCAADALGSTGDPRAIPPLLNLLAAGDHDARIIRALARLDCHAVLEEALTWRSTGKVGAEVFSHIGRDDPRAVALLESNAYGWFTDRHSRAEAVSALARMGRLPTPTKAGLFAHVLVGLMILAGIVFLVAPRATARLLGNTHRCWLAGIGTGSVLAGLGVLYMLHFTIFF